MPNIASAGAMVRGLNNLSSLKLDDQGNIHKRGKIGTFFQKLGDAFRGISANGKQLIAQRNNNLRAAISGRLNQLFPETRQGVGAAGAEGLRNPAVINTYKSLQAIDKTLARTFADPPLPAAVRGKLRGAIAHQMDVASQTENINPPLMQSPARMQAKLTQMLQNTCFQDMKKVLAQPAKIQENNAALRTRLTDDFKTEFAKEAQQAEINPDTAVHASFVKDITRNPVTINGVRYNTADPGVENLTQNIPNDRARSLVSMLASQAGGVGALSLLAQGLKGIEGGMMPFLQFPSSSNNISIHDGFVEVSSTLTAQSRVSHSEQLGDSEMLHCYKYEATFRLPINQPAPPAAPIVECTRLQTTPIEQ
jgi:hypothetical protein